MKKKTLILTSIGLASVGLLATAGLTSAQFRAFFDEETREKLKEAEENKDYNSWKEIIESQPRITDYVESQEEFEKYLEMRELLKEGKTEEAEAIAEEIGLPEMPKGMKGAHGVRGGHNQEALEAINNKDYDAWLEAVPEEAPIRDVIDTENKFEKFVEMHEALKNGDTDKAEEIAEELGLPERKPGVGMRRNRLEEGQEDEEDVQEN